MSSAGQPDFFENSEDIEEQEDEEEELRKQEAETRKRHLPEAAASPAKKPSHELQDHEAEELVAMALGEHPQQPAPVPGKLNFRIIRPVVKQILILFEANFLKHFIGLLKAFHTSVKFVIDKQGIHGAFLDTAHVIIMRFELRAEKLRRFECTDKPVELGLDLEKLALIISTAGPHDWILLKHNPSAGGTVGLIELSVWERQAAAAAVPSQPPKGRAATAKKPAEPRLEKSSSYRMALQEDENICPEPHEIVEPAQLEMPGSQFFAMINKLSRFSDVVRMHIEPELFRLSVGSEGGEGGEEVVRQARSDGSLQPCLFACTGEQICDVSFGTAYLSRLAAVATLARTMTIALKRDCPLKLVFPLELGWLEFYLAAQVEVD